MNGTKSIGDIVSDSPTAAKVFYKYRLDYCCGGEQSLDAACAEKGLDPKRIISEIEKETPVVNTFLQWREQPLDVLIDHILESYHNPLKAELSRLIELAEKVEKAHEEKPDVPVGLSQHLKNIRVAVSEHLAKEEQILFPMIKAVSASNADLPIAELIQEHENHGENLVITREITEDFKLPDYACNSWRELYRALDQLERELMDHIHLENNILFPRASHQ